MNTTQREFLKSIYNIPFKIAFDIFIFNESNNAAQGEGIDNAIRDERKKKKKRGKHPISDVMYAGKSGREVGRETQFFQLL